MSTGLRNTLAIIAFVIALFWAMAHAPTSRGAKTTTKQAVCKVFKTRCGAAWRVVMCESRGNPRAVGGAGERGIGQIHPIHFHRTVRSHVGAVYVNPRRLFDPAFNARVMWVMSRGGTDWGPWTCRWAA